MIISLKVFRFNFLAIHSNFEYLFGKTILTRCTIPDCQRDSKCFTNHANSKERLSSISKKDDVILKWQATINASSPLHPIILKPEQTIYEDHFAGDESLTEKKCPGQMRQLLLSLLISESNVATLPYHQFSHEG